MENTIYPELIQRFKAVFADSLFVILMMYGCTAVFESIGDVDNNIRMASFVFVVLLYDPLTTTCLGGTLGHIIIGLRVKRSTNLDRNIHIGRALLRYTFKLTLGVISLLTVTSHPEGRAIHDMIAGSVVIEKNRK